MANVVLGYSDHVAGGTVTASTELPTLPAINLQHPFMAPNRWRSTANVATIDVDFGAAYSNGVIALLKSNLTAAATFRLRLSNSPSMTPTVYDTGVSQINAGVDTHYGNLIHILPTAQSSQYLRLELTDSSLTYIEAGRLFSGAKFQPSHNYAYDYKRTTLDSVRFTESESGQNWTEVGVRKEEVRLHFEALTDAEVQSDFAFIRLTGRHKDVLAVLNPASSNLGRDSIFGQITENLSDQHSGFNRHMADLVIVERK